jgi:hypothetical protein
LKRLALHTLVPVVVVLAVSIGLGWLLGSSGVSAAGLRDLAIIILAVFSLVGTLVAVAAVFAGAWAIGRFGPRGVAAVRWVGGKIGLAEAKVGSIAERAALRPVARSARLFTSGATFARAVLPSGKG